MALERPPSLQAAAPETLKRFRPPNEKVLRYHVVVSGSAETLVTVANANHMSVETLVDFNFPGAVRWGKIVPEIVNWYLNHHEGFRCPDTADGKNRRFKGGEKLAIPKSTVIMLEPLAITVRTSVDELMIYAKDESAFTTLAEKFEKEDPHNHKAEQVSSASDISVILDRYTDLKQINFYTHGNVGYVHLAGGGVTKSTVSLLAAPHPGLFAGPGRVLFTGCNVAEGPGGRDFLIAAGQALLKGHGGCVGGTTSANVFGRWGLFDARMPKWGELRVIELDAGGTVVAEKLF